MARLTTVSVSVSFLSVSLKPSPRPLNMPVAYSIWPFANLPRTVTPRSRMSP